MILPMMPPNVPVSEKIEQETMTTVTGAFNRD
jgi:hypothetical protein